jgi:hypothetical protein
LRGEEVVPSKRLVYRRQSVGPTTAQAQERISDPLLMLHSHFVGHRRCPPDLAPSPQVRAVQVKELQLECIVGGISKGDDNRIFEVSEPNRYTLDSICPGAKAQPAWPRRSLLRGNIDQLEAVWAALDFDRQSFNLHHVTLIPS